MTGKVLNNAPPAALALILPIAVVVTLILKTWQVLLSLLVLGLLFVLWQNYQWRKWSAKVNPFFNELVEENQGCLTPMDLSIKANLTSTAAKRFLDKKAEEFGASRRLYEDKGIVYYFLTTSAIRGMFADSDPETVEEAVRKDDKASESLTTQAELKSDSSLEETNYKLDQLKNFKLSEPTNVEETQFPLAAQELVEERSFEEEEFKTTQTELPTQETSTEEVVNQIAQTELPDLEAPAEEVVNQTTQTELPDLEAPAEEVVNQTTQTELPDLEAPAEEVVNQTAQTELPDQVEENALETPASEEEEEIETTVTEELSNLSQLNQNTVGLIQSDLARRLRVTPKTISKRKSAADFGLWSQSRDPQGLTWKYSPENGMFIPEDPKNPT